MKIAAICGKTHTHLFQIDEQQRAEKINLALLKLKEASRKKLFVKIFCADGSTKSILVDDALHAADVLDILVEKNHVQLQPTWALVEHLPELYMER